MPQKMVQGAALQPRIVLYMPKAIDHSLDQLYPQGPAQSIRCKYNVYCSQAYMSV